MNGAARGKPVELTALLIAPDRELAAQFCTALNETHAFQILADHRAYPPQQTLEIRLRQLNPDVVLLDLATDLGAACEVIRMVRAAEPGVQVIGLHRVNDREAVVQSLRAGATDYLAAPFEATVQQEALSRVLRLRQPEEPVQQESGKVVIFCSTKPGSGASTLATQVAFGIRRASSKRVLLMDMDLLGGTVGFSLKLDHPYSMLDVIQRLDKMDAVLWSTLAARVAGVDVLPSPEMPADEVVDPPRMHAIFEFARQLYDWVIVDLPSIFQRTSLLAISEADLACLVSTVELPSLHLTHRAVAMLGQLGIEKERFQVVLNRVGKKNSLGGSDIQKILHCEIRAQVPNDYFALHRAVTLGQPLNGSGELGRAIEALAGALAGAPPAERRRSDELLSPRPALSQT